MKVKVRALTKWKDVRRAARYTQGKSDIKTPVSGMFKHDILKSEHSPLRTYVWLVELEGIPSYVSTHLVRHKFGVEHFVSTSRPDIIDKPDRHEQRKDDPCNHMMVINAQALIEISRKRMCSCAEKTTQQIWRKVVSAIRKKDQMLASYMQPQCCRIGFCPERRCCGLVDNVMIKTIRELNYLK